MNNLQKLSGISAIFEAVIYIGAFVYFGMFWEYPFEGSASEQMAYLVENQFVVSAIYFLMYGVFGVFLAILVVGLYEKLKLANDPMVKIGSLFGVVWVVLVIACGMLANIGLLHALYLMNQSSEKAFDLWRTLTAIIESLGGGNELVGGLWVLFLSVAAIRMKEFSVGLNYLGLVVGISGIATIYPEELLTEVFGVTQIVWFVWLGLSLLRKDNSN